MSKNRNRYGRKTLQEAAPLYEGAKIFLDHQEETRRFGRSVKDQAGFLKNVQPVLLGRGADGKESAVPCSPWRPRRWSRSRPCGRKCWTPTKKATPTFTA
jgi:hypothetical protein